MDFTDVPVNFSKDFVVLRHEVLEIIVGASLIAIFCFEEVRKLLQRIDIGGRFIACTSSASGFERNTWVFAGFFLNTGKEEEFVFDDRSTQC